MGCVKFRKRKKKQQDYVSVVKSYRCASPIGRQSFRQEVELGPFCMDMASILHELNHAIGFEHEHLRPDRGDYIEILYENIVSEEGRKNMRMRKSRRNWSVFNESYDLYSLMHYGPYSYGNGKITIKTKDPFYHNIIGQGKGLSYSDIKKIRRMYKCPTKLEDSVI
ncbi:Zinc metalloproteinase nas-1 [Armadillidium nasatum]|uniref:Metalloendopeptidase n=1 Tax=Armadillidium nasatum TaxID=96803 RepID=A0A5N5TBM1_9CRUS|nr:Zinc metalloproteinase nas-1 [Armadillidium nasatum]